MTMILPSLANAMPISDLRRRAYPRGLESNRAARLGSFLILLIWTVLADPPPEFHVEISPAIGGIVMVRIPDAGSNDVFSIQSSSDLIHWTSCAAVAAASNDFKVGFFTSSPGWAYDQQFFRARRL